MIIHIIKLSILLLIISVHSMMALADSKSNNFINVTYEKPKSKKEKAILTDLNKEKVSELVAEVLEEIFKTIDKKPLALVYGDEDGPSYDSRKKSIYIPYDFIQEIKQRFIDVKYSNSGISLNDAVMDVVMHTILHEVAHALIDRYELPVVGKEEDAADSLATMLLIEYFEDGQEVVLTAADLFDLESEDVKECAEEDFWDEHSLDVQRYYRTVCYVYGSDPKKYADIKKDAKFSDDRADLCIDEYEQAYFSWMKLLKPLLKAQKGDNK